MVNVLLVFHIVIALLLITVILLQKTGSDGLSGLSGGSNTGVISAQSAANFLTKTTVILASLFIVNALVLGNLSIRTEDSIATKMKPTTQNQSSLPMAK